MRVIRVFVVLTASVSIFMAGMGLAYYQTNQWKLEAYEHALATAQQIEEEFPLHSCEERKIPL